MRYVQRIHGERHPCHQFTNTRRPTQTKQQVSPCFQFPRLILRIVEIVAPDAVEFGVLQEHVNEKGVSRRNGSFRLTNFCNDFFKSARWRGCVALLPWLFQIIFQTCHWIALFRQASQYMSGLPLEKRPCASEFPPSNQNCDWNLASWTCREWTRIRVFSLFLNDTLAWCCDCCPSSRQTFLCLRTFQHCALAACGPEQALWRTLQRFNWWQQKILSHHSPWN